MHLKRKMGVITILLIIIGLPLSTNNIQKSQALPPGWVEIYRPKNGNEYAVGYLREFRFKAFTNPGVEFIYSKAWLDDDYHGLFETKYVSYMGYYGSVGTHRYKVKAYYLYRGITIITKVSTFYVV